MDGENNNKSVWKIIWKIIRYTVILAVFVMIGWVLLRSCWQKGTAKMKDYIWTEQASNLYGKHKLTVKEYLDYNDTNAGRIFYIGNIRYTEEIGQFQFMLRYNNIAASDLGLSDRNEEKFCFVLTDGNGKEYTEYDYITDEKSMYNYYRVVFSNVDVTNVSELFVKIYIANEKGISSKESVDTCIVWYNDGTVIEEGLSDDEKKAEKPTPKLKHYRVRTSE